jgi:hypothetical protein
VVPKAAAPTSGRTDLPGDGDYCIFRPRGTFEAWGRVNWWPEHKDPQLGRWAMADLVTEDDLEGDGSVNMVREIARCLGWAYQTECAGR